MLDVACEFDEDDEGELPPELSTTDEAEAAFDDDD